MTIPKPKKAPSPKISLRLSPALFRASSAAAKAAGLSVGEWLRSLAERETGTPADTRRGFAAQTQRRRRQIATSGAAARYAHQEPNP